MYAGPTGFPPRKAPHSTHSTIRAKCYKGVTGSPGNTRIEGPTKPTNPPASLCGLHRRLSHMARPFSIFRVTHVTLRTRHCDELLGWMTCANWCWNPTPFHVYRRLAAQFTIKAPPPSGSDSQPLRPPDPYYRQPALTPSDYTGSSLG